MRILRWFLLSLLLPIAAHAQSTINTALPANGVAYSASVIRGNFSAAANDINALISLNAGASAPKTCNLAAIGTPWLNNSTTPYTLNFCDGTGNWIAQDYWDVSNHIVTPPTGRGTCQTITASATTDLGTIPQSCITITGNSGVSITSLGASAKAGDLKIVSFNGANTLVYNSVSLILPGAANITTTSASVFVFESLGSGNWLAVAGGPNGGGGSGVTSFNARTGAVVPASNDYSFSQINGTIAYNQLITPLQSGTTDYIPYWQSSSVLANGSPATIASTVLPAIASPGTGTNVSGTLGSPGTSVTISADGFVVCSALTSAKCTELGSFNQTFQGSTVGAGGMDTGGLPSSGTVALYAIYNASSPSTSILGCSTAESGCGGTVYTAANMPVGYTQSGLLVKWATNSTPNLVAGTLQSVTPYSVTSATFPNAAPGTSVNVSASLATAGASVTITADSVVVGTSLTGNSYPLGSYSEAFNGGTNGAGGMDTGSLPSNGFVCIYAIYNPTTNTKSILGVNCATSSGTIYSGSNMPSGYTASALLAAWPTNATPNMVVAYLKNRSLVFAKVQAVTSSSQVVTFTSVSISSIVPPNAVSVGGYATVQDTSGSNNTMSVEVASDANGVGVQEILGSSTASMNVDAPFVNILMPTAQTIFWKYLASAAATGTIQISQYSW